MLLTVHNDHRSGQKCKPWISVIIHDIQKFFEKIIEQYDKQMDKYPKI